MSTAIPSFNGSALPVRADGGDAHILSPDFQRTSAAVGRCLDQAVKLSLCFRFNHSHHAGFGHPVASVERTPWTTTLDDDAWLNCPTAAMGQLRELQTGRQPVFGTTVKSAWIGNNLYFAIRCDEHPGEKLNIATTRNEDPATWYGDLVEILLETQSHSYYQIAVTPSGAIIDLDRGAERSAWFGWNSQAEVTTHVADDYWTVEIRIPVTQDENDPLHQVIGHKPTASLPWHFNVCRQRIRDNGAEHSAFSPTGTDNYHVAMKFAHFYDGRPQKFDADSTVSDYTLSPAVPRRT